MTKTINTRPPEQPEDGDLWGERLACGGVVWWKDTANTASATGPVFGWWSYAYDTVQTHGSKK